MSNENRLQAIVLGTVKYGDNGRVLKTFTGEKGLVTYMVHSLRSKGSGHMRPALTMPMTVLDIIENSRSKGNLKTIAEVHPAIHWIRIHTDPVRMTLCTFAAEVLAKSSSEEHKESLLFDEVLAWLQRLDAEHSRLGTAPHELLLIVARQIGCFPNVDEYREGRVFDMLNAHFVDDAPEHAYWMTANESRALHQLIHHQPVDRSMRERLLDELLSYIRLHHEPFGTLKSVDILRTILS